MERRPREIYPDVCDAYEQNHSLELELMGRINACLALKYRRERPRQPEHIGEQEEVLAQLQELVDYLGGVTVKDATCSPRHQS